MGFLRDKPLPSSLGSSIWGHCELKPVLKPWLLPLGSRWQSSARPECSFQALQRNAEARPEQKAIPESALCSPEKPRLAVRLLLGVSVKGVRSGASESRVKAGELDYFLVSEKAWGKGKERKKKKNTPCLKNFVDVCKATSH